MNLCDFLETRANAQGERLALIDDARGERLSYGQLRARVEDARRRLEAFGVRPGQRVGLLARNSIDYVVASFALLAREAAIVPVSTRLAPEEREAIVRRIALHAIIEESPAPAGPSVDAAAKESGPSPSERLTGVLSVRWLDPDAGGPAGFAEIQPAFLRFTSGTTGDSKGVVLSHRTVAERCRAANEVLRIGPDDTVLWIMPMAYHFTVTIVSYLSEGAAIVLCPPDRPERMAALARAHGATILYASPLQYRAMIDGAGDDPGTLDRVRLAIATAIGLPADVAADFLHAFGRPLNECYGVIEVGLPFVNHDAPIDKRGSVGRALPAYEARLANDEGRTVRDGDIGEVCVKGPGLLDAYYSPWRRRDEILDQGGFRTGDLGRFDAQGYLRIVGRRKEVINVDGMKVFPADVERALDAHPAVRESRVYGRPDPGRGERVCASIVPVDSQVPLSVEETLRHCRALLADYEVPDEVRVVRAIPRTPSGKIRRR